MKKGKYQVRITPKRLVVDHIRSLIVSGRIGPGMRLPTRTELERLFKTSPVTVQRAFDQLTEEGFVISEGRRGTFVAKNPPHLERYAIVFPYRNRPERPWSHFWTALSAEAEGFRLRNGHDLISFFGNETHLDLESYRVLETDVLSHRLAGIIFVSKPFYLKGSAVLGAEGIPKVALMPHTDPELGGVKAVAMEPRLIEAAVRALVGSGRRRIGVITVPQMWEEVTRELGMLGVEVPLHWVQAASPEAPGAAGNMVKLLMGGGEGNRPDGLFVSDDNLVPSVTDAIAELGLKVPGEVMVVAHANFPHPTRSAVEAMRLGYDVRQVIEVCVGILDRMRRGEPVPEVTYVPVVSGLEKRAEVRDETLPA